jgi:NADPH-dependent 2,4-dienoyl-CoA reductase/sulfur reductase-like enzyme/peroxiredoxin family protein/rhodanese-related sulfurtransferase/TusA-related sulfurtransferase
MSYRPVDRDGFYQRRDNMSDPTRIVIVGGVAGGASAAARARRLSEEAEIIMFERGEEISFANCGMPYHIGGKIPDRDRLLVQTPEKMWQRYRVDVRTGHEVLHVDRENRSVLVRNRQTGEETSHAYDQLILSPGAEAIRPPIPGADADGVFTLRGLHDMDAIRGVLEEKQPRRAVVVGGGYIGLEMAEALRNRDIDVTLVELADQVFVAADPEMVSPLHKQLELHGVDLRLETSITSVKQGEDGLAAQLSSGEGVECGIIILAVGVQPEIDLARDAGLEIGENGGIVVDEHMRTSDPHIFAVGDAVEVTHFVSGHKTLIPLAGPANRQGRIAADNALGRESTYSDKQGTAICKVFDLSAGMTGMSEKQLIGAEVPYEKVYVHPASHAGYYPGASQMSLKLLFNPESGRVLGAQAVGADGVDKRIDVLATALRAEMTVEDLSELELAYAPPYGSAKDPVNYAGFVASNVRCGDMRVCHVEDVDDPNQDQFLLDVRTPPEVEAGTIPGATNIPLDDLRERMAELPEGREILVFCQVGLRGYLACRVLEQNGFRCSNLTGGYKTYRAAIGAVTEEDATETEMTEDTGGEAPEVADPRRPASETAEVVREIDACALQCPGPIMRLKEALGAVQPGQAVSIVAGDPAFPSDVEAWCHSTGNRLLETIPENGHTRATIVKGTPRTTVEGERDGGGSVADQKTMIVFSGDFDRAMASFIIANGAASMGSEVTMFFTFWGLNVLRRPDKVDVEKSFIERMFGWMMPRGAEKLGMSRMNMGGMGPRMIKGIMCKKNVSSLSEMIESARESGVRLVACSMSMDLMGIKSEELIEGVEEGGVATYLANAEQGNVNLFI